MRRLLVFLLVLMVPQGVAMATELDELLEESRSASYSAEQLIVCNTPEGARDALIELEQRAGEVRYGTAETDGPQVWSGYGGWVVQTEGSVVESATVTDDDSLSVENTYVVEEQQEVSYLGRASTRYALLDGELSRAELVVDQETGVLVSVTTFDSDGEPYCERRFVSFDPQTPDWADVDSGSAEHLAISTAHHLPEDLAGFVLLDAYVDDAGLTFGYYSDGFFSFAVFESGVEIVLEGGSEFSLDGRPYLRQFTPGQVTYTWRVQDGGMALIGDLPPDMHDPVLQGLPAPYDAGFFKRLWRSLFG